MLTTSQRKAFQDSSESPFQSTPDHKKPLDFYHSPQDGTKDSDTSSLNNSLRGKRNSESDFSDNDSQQDVDEGRHEVYNSYEKSAKLCFQRLQPSRNNTILAQQKSLDKNPTPTQKLLQENDSKVKRNKSNEANQSDMKRESLLPQSHGEIRLMKINRAIVEEQQMTRKVDKAVREAEQENKRLRGQINWLLKCL
ncbi:hypothetical protein FGO68_gene7894 [Halteria grandinella]|uniref:Uncharacterized protein n=1 Tax=Halteria grandinella TaxID=5974 RepID=A0A8J8P091_HALGN|nr:hypothetical protein FGO68_gene7894 [Halteria grandinella]